MEQPEHEAVTPKEDSSGDTSTDPFVEHAMQRVHQRIKVAADLTEDLGLPPEDMGEVLATTHGVEPVSLPNQAGHIKKQTDRSTQ